MIAVNDGLILRNHIFRILMKHFKGKPYYMDLLELFNEVSLLLNLLQTADDHLAFDIIRSQLVYLNLYFDSRLNFKQPRAK